MPSHEAQYPIVIKKRESSQQKREIEDERVWKMPLTNDGASRPDSADVFARWNDWLQIFLVPFAAAWCLQLFGRCSCSPWRRCSKGCWLSGMLLLFFCLFVLRVFVSVLLFVFVFHFVFVLFVFLLFVFFLDFFLLFVFLLFFFFLI